MWEERDEVARFQVAEVKLEREDGWKVTRAALAQNSVNTVLFPPSLGSNTCLRDLLVYMAFKIKRKTNKVFGKLASHF